MKKSLLVFIILATAILSGCSLIEGVNNTLDYTEQATEHINRLLNFGEEAPQLIRDAANNPEIKNELQNKLEVLKADIVEFNQINAPTIAKDIHEKLVNKIEEIKTVINESIQNGELIIDKIENSHIFQLISDVNRLMNQIEQLGL